MTNAGGASSCPHCGARYDAAHRFCGTCGQSLPGGARDAAPPPRRPENAPPAHPSADAELNRLAGPRYSADDRLAPSRSPYPAQATDNAAPYYIPPSRIILLSVLTAGLYFVYWTYLTWRHYRDYTGETAFPVWHALCMLVPVYQFFRLHAHMRVYQELMLQRGLPTTLNPLLAVLLLVSAMILGWTAYLLSTAPEMTDLHRLGYFGCNVADVGLLAWIVWRAQNNLNRFWRHQVGTRLAFAPPTIFEGVLVVIGLILWGLWLVTLFYPELVPVPPADAPGAAP